jgi:GT2 family glycosyltransferase
MKTTDISVLILTCDRPTELAWTLQDLAKQSRRINELLVVNNSRVEQPTRAIIEDLGRLTSSYVLYLRGSPVFGTASGRNAALGESTGDVVFLFDDDLRFPTRDYLDQVCRVFEDDANGSIGAVTTPAGPTEAPTWYVQARLRARRLAKLLFGIDSLRPGSVTRSGIQAKLPKAAHADVDWLQGCVSAIRRDVAESLRFDEGLERRPLALSEDVEFGLQVRRRWRIRFLGDTFAVNGHVGRQGTATQWLDDEARFELIVRNYDRINRRHRPGTINRLAFWWAMAGIGIERIAAMAVRQRSAKSAWRGYVRGTRAVLAGDDSVDQPTRTVERVVLSGVSRRA